MSKIILDWNYGKYGMFVQRKNAILIMVVSYDDL